MARLIRTSRTAARISSIAGVMLLSLATACSTGPAGPTTTGLTTTGLAGAASSVPAAAVGPAAPPTPSAPRQSEGGTTAPPSVDAGAASTTAPSPVRQGSTAPSARVRFQPTSIELPSGDNAVIEPAHTVDGVLEVPADVQHVGWWDGSSYAGDPFGATVLAGHVDSREQGLGFFAQLLMVQVGDLITLRSDGNTLTYQVVSSSLVQKQALTSDGEALDQRGPHRLVMITCSGQWHPEIRSYDSNLVLVADPVVP